MSDSIPLSIAPHISKDLVDWLDEICSADLMSPKVSQSDREIWMNAGKRELIGFLKNTRKDQETGEDQGFPHVFVRSGGSADDLDSSGSDAGPRAGAGGSYPSPEDRLRG